MKRSDDVTATNFLEDGAEDLLVVVKVEEFVVFVKVVIVVLFLVEKNVALDEKRLVFSISKPIQKIQNVQT